MKNFKTFSANILSREQLKKIKGGMLDDTICESLPYMMGGNCACDVTMTIYSPDGSTSVEVQNPVLISNDSCVA